MNKFRLFVAAILTAVSGSVMADSAPIFGMPGSDVMPISNNDIRLVSETIDFYLLDDEYMVEVNYNFYNEGKTQEIEVGFPTVSDHNDDDGYRNFHATVNGSTAMVTRKLGKWSLGKKKGESVQMVDQDGKEIAKSDCHSNNCFPFECNGNAFDAFKVTFKAGDTTKVMNSYEQNYEALGHSGGSFFWYILETGRYWKGKIDKVTVRIHTENYKKSRNYFVSSHKYDNYVREFKNIEPDFNLFYPLKNFARSMPEASSTLQSGKNNSYGVENLIDENPATAWVEGVDGYGEGETLDFCMACNFDYDCGSENIYKINIVNGYAKNETTFKNNSRVKELEVHTTELVEKRIVEASNGSYFNINDEMCVSEDLVYADRYYYFVLDDTMKEQTLDLGGEKDVFKVTFKIISVYKGDKYKDTAISGIRFN